MNTWDINILVNGKRCKQYQHAGKTFVEAKVGSEYSIEIKNNYWKRILAVSSVDGLDVLTGKTASEDASGYVIPSYSSEKIKGFRFSDDEWAIFKFGYKFNGNTYAQNKEDGSEKNCGVIGIRLFYEEEPQKVYIQSTPWTTPWTTPCHPWNTPSYPDIISGASTIRYGYCTDDSNYTTNIDDCSSNMMADMASTLPKNPPVPSERKIKSMKVETDNSALRGFDMGTEWGRKETSKTTTVDFKRGYLAREFDIYYASRESLIEMGISLTNEIQVSLPESFPSKYATPPKGWNG